MGCEPNGEKLRESENKQKNYIRSKEPERVETRTQQQKQGNGK